MKTAYTSAGIAFRSWVLTGLFTGVGLCIVETFQFHETQLIMFGASVAASIIGSFPAFILMLIFIPFINRANKSWREKARRFLLLQFFITACYGIFGAVISFPINNFLDAGTERFLSTALICFTILFAAALLAFLLVLKRVAVYFSGNNAIHLSYNDIFLSLFQQVSKTNQQWKQFIMLKNQRNKINQINY